MKLMMLLDRSRPVGVSYLTFYYLGILPLRGSPTPLHP